MAKKDTATKPTEAQEQKIHELENQQFTATFTVKQKNSEGNLTEYTLHYNYEELNVDRVGAATVSYFAYDDLLGKPTAKVAELDHAIAQQFLKRFYGAVLFERDEDGLPKEFNPIVQNNKPFELVGNIIGKENHQLLDQIKIDFFLNRGEIPNGLQGKVKSITELMLQDSKIRATLVEEVVSQIVPNGKSKLHKKERDALVKGLEALLGKE